MSRSSGFDMVTVLTREHRDMEAMLERLESTPTELGERRGSMAATLARELLRHWEVEREYLYPVVRRFLPDGEQLMAADERARRAVDDAARTLEQEDPRPGNFEALLGELVATARRHVHDQEAGMLAALNRHANRGDLEWLGDMVDGARACARQPAAE